MSAPPEIAAKVLSTACPLDCPDACSLDVHVAGDRVVKIEGTDRNPITSGYICAKVNGFDRHLYCDERLKTPLRRISKKGAPARGFEDFEPISWDEALDLTAKKMLSVKKAHGGEAILPFSYGGSNGYLTQDTTDARLFHRIGASRLKRAVCAAPTGAVAQAIYGKMAGVAYDDYVHAKLIVVWGANPSASGIHLVPIIQKAQKAGARLVVVDPRKTPLAKKADLHLAIRPGTDLPVALAMLRHLYERGRADTEFLAENTTGYEELRCRADDWPADKAAEIAGIEARDILRFAELYAMSSPAVIRCGWGQERNRNGGSATAAILALPAVAGKFGVRGGGFTMSQSGIWKLDASELIDAPEPETRVINMNRLGRVLLGEELGEGPPVKCLFVYNCNPYSTMPEQQKVHEGLLRKDLFTVVYDQVLTDTARYADLVLPATTFLEHRELAAGYGSIVLNSMQPVIEPVGESRCNTDVFAELCRRTGVAKEGDADDVEAFAEALIASREEIAGTVREDGHAFPPSGRNPIQMVDVRPLTDDGKIHLVPRELDRQAPKTLYTYRDDPATKKYPLALISPSTRRTVNSTCGQLHKKTVPIEIHPDDAAERGIATGDEVRIWNKLGEVRTFARISADLPAGTASLAKGIWSHNTSNGWSSNALSPATFTDIADGACFNDARVQIEKV